MNARIKNLLSAGAVALVVAGCATVQSWEYRTRTTKERIGKTVLDQYGKSGWELVQFARIPVIEKDDGQVISTNMEYEYIFKRPKK